MSPANFKNEWWDLLDQRLDRIECKQDSLASDVSAIKEKMKWVFGFAAAFSLFFGAAWQIAKDKIASMKWL